MACAIILEANTGRTVSGSKMSTRPLSQSVSASEAKYPQGGWTPVTMRQKTANLERSDSSAARPYSDVSRQLGYSSRSIPNPYHHQRPSLTLGGWLIITIMIVQQCSRTWRKRGYRGGWFWGCWQRQEQRCRPVVWCISKWGRQCFCKAVKVGWWWGRCWRSWRGFIIGRPGGLRGWRQNMWQVGDWEFLPVVAAPEPACLHPI